MGSSVSKPSKKLKQQQRTMTMDPDTTAHAPLSIQPDTHVAPAAAAPTMPASPPPLSPEEARRRQRTQSMDLLRSRSPSPASVSPVASVTPEQDDVYAQLNALQERLQDMNVEMYMSLKMVLEMKLGKNAHISSQEMVKFKSHSDSIAEEYRRFQDQVHACVRVKMGETSDCDLEKNVLVALDYHQSIFRHVDTIHALIDQLKSQIDPQKIILANSEYGSLQRFYVHPRYKEMVKGCGGTRSQYHAMWAGIQQPGDGWLNELLKCFWRERDATCPPPRLNQQQQSLSEMDMIRRLDLMSARATDPSVLDIVSLEHTIQWMRHVHDWPEAHSEYTREVVANAVEKMGGWSWFARFYPHWLQQFYQPVGRSGIPYPLPGCKAWMPQAQSTGDGLFGKSPLSMPLSELSQLSIPFSERMDGSCRQMGRSSHLTITTMTKAPSSDFPRLGPVNPSQDQRWWDYLWYSACRELLDLHELLDKELEGGDLGMELWLSLVESTALLTTGEYGKLPPTTASDPFSQDDSLSPEQRQRLHPTLIRIRERAIIINASLKPDRIRFLRSVEQEIRATFTPPPLLSPLSPVTLIKTEPTEPVSRPARKTHRKSMSTGVMERASKLLHSHSKSLSHDANAVYPGTTTAQVEADRKRERAQSVPAIPYEAWRPMAGGYTNFYLETQRLCKEIVMRRALPGDDLILRAFRVSEVVVRHYLVHELPAKYQSSY